MLRNQLTTKTVMKINYTYCVAPFLKVTNFAIQEKFHGIFLTKGLKPMAAQTHTMQVNKFCTKSTNIVATEKGHLVMAYINICT